MLTVVTGPPCGGKSTYVRQHAKPTDVVIDQDEIAAAISGPGAPDHGAPEHVRRVALDGRDVMMARAAYLGLNGVCDVWIIQTTLTGKYAALCRQARVVTIDPGLEVCLHRACAERPPYFVDLIRRWYAERVANAVVE